MRASHSHTIAIDDDSELGRALDSFPREPIVIVRGMRRFRLVSETAAETSDIWANYDPERVRVALEKVAGTLTPEEGDRLKEAIYRAREEGTRPPDRP
ncbi:MAG: hypothetical protein M3Z20_11445 [Chloroflexota bacterium]|nr:hypothetical protein [Chloroflexota bacterium]